MVSPYRQHGPSMNQYSVMRSGSIPPHQIRNSLPQGMSHLYHQINPPINGGSLDQTSQLHIPPSASSPIPNKSNPTPPPPYIRPPLNQYSIPPGSAPSTINIVPSNNIPLSVSSTSSMSSNDSSSAVCNPTDSTNTVPSNITTATSSVSSVITSITTQVTNSVQNSNSPSGTATPVSVLPGNLSESNSSSEAETSENNPTINTTPSSSDVPTSVLSKNQNLVGSSESKLSVVSPSVNTHIASPHSGVEIPDQIQSGPSTPIIPSGTPRSLHLGPPHLQQPRSNISPYHTGIPQNYYESYPSTNENEEPVASLQYHNSHFPENYSADASLPSDSNSKDYEDEASGEFGGLVSYFSSQREDDLDS